ncbi:MAG: filamentous hemagglutinin N-terminal domain-containing protein [Xenococcaceae cyanobacterium]
MDNGAVRGTNLFHSFTEFNVGEGRGVFFDAPGNIQNILTRVTGKNLSNIMGTLGVLGEANLFLINPNGIIFGQNARLDVNGSFVATTANALQFGQQGFFSATNPETPTLLTVQPSALFFNQLNSGVITNNSIASAGKDPIGNDISGLRVGDGSSLLLIGGDVNLNGGKLQARGGRIELGGLQDEGAIELNIQNKEFNLVFPTNAKLSNVSLDRGAEVNVREEDRGSIAINAQNLDLTNGSLLLAGINEGVGSINSQAGNIDIKVIDTIKITNHSFIVNVVQRDATGNGGDINIKTGSFLLTDESRIITSPIEQGSAGDITITAQNLISVDDSSFDSGTENSFKRGNITLTATDILLNNESSLSASTFGKGNAGNINLTAQNLIFFDNESRLSSNADRNSSGNGGDITLTAKEILIDNGSLLSGSTFGSGNAGNITLTAQNLISVNGEKDANSTVFSSVAESATGNGGIITINTGSLSLTNNGQIVVNTFGQGNAGIVNINARDTVFLDGTGSDIFESGIFSGVSLNTEGNSGNINIETNSLSLSNSAAINADTSGAGNGGNITITANNLSAESGGQIFTTSRSNGNAGDITLNLTESLNLSGVSPIDNAQQRFTNAGSSSGLFANTESDSTGDGGNIFINGSDSMIVNITDNAQITASSAGKGEGGEIRLQGNFLSLDRGQITAEAFGNQGGNITLTLQDLLLLKNNSQINASAGNNSDPGDGGNINIDASFIVAFPTENSDITANAFEGSGGNIDINATGIFGIEARKITTPKSDITAISQENPSLNGQINLNTLEIEPSRQLFTFPTQPLNSQIAQNCTPGTKVARSELIFIGKGGIAPNTLEALQVNPTKPDWVELPSDSEHSSQSRTSIADSPKPTPQIVEAQGWIRDENGEAILVADTSSITTHDSWQKPQQCD